MHVAGRVPHVLVDRTSELPVDPIDGELYGHVPRSSVAAEREHVLQRRIERMSLTREIIAYGDLPRCELDAERAEHVSCRRHCDVDQDDHSSRASSSTPEHTTSTGYVPSGSHAGARATKASTSSRCLSVRQSSTWNASIQLSRCVIRPR